MNCSRSCFRRLLGTLSLGITNRSRGGTCSPISCISPSTIHQSDFSSVFLAAKGGDLDRRLFGPAPVLNWRSWWAVDCRHGDRWWSRFTREDMRKVGLRISGWDLGAKV
jgi:hypothetical protein